MTSQTPTAADIITFTKEHVERHKTLDDGQLARQCPLDNARSINNTTTSSPRCSVGQLDQLPSEMLISVLLFVDIPSLTRFRRVNRRAMDLVDSVPQYAALIKQCPGVVRATVSLEADAFDCNTLYETLGTIECSTCERFGDYLYLIDCRRVCFVCYTTRLEYFPFTSARAARLYAAAAPSDGSNASANRRSIESANRRRLHLAKLPTVMSIPGEYSIRSTSRKKRVELVDRRSVVGVDMDQGRPKQDVTTGESLRFMTIIPAPHLFDAGRQVDWGVFCLGCRHKYDKTGQYTGTGHTQKQLAAHMERYGPLKCMTGPGRLPRIFSHDTRAPKASQFLNSYRY